LNFGDLSCWADFLPSAHEFRDNLPAHIAKVMGGPFMMAQPASFSPRTAAASLLLLASLTSLAAPALAKRPGPRLGPHPEQLPPPSLRTVPGDLCSAPLSLPRGASVTVDLCAAWNDYDPGAFGCSSCALPGPDVVAVVDTQPGEQLRLEVDLVSGNADVRVYLATDCEDPVGTCVVATDAPSGSLHHTLLQGGTLTVYLDTTGECGEVTLSRQQAASTAGTDLTTLKAVYR
jgi:hypothetical protein